MIEWDAIYLQKRGLTTWGRYGLFVGIALSAILRLQWKTLFLLRRPDSVLIVELEKNWGWILCARKSTGELLRRRSKKCVMMQSLVLTYTCYNWVVIPDCILVLRGCCELWVVTVLSIKDLFGEFRQNIRVSDEDFEGSRNHSSDSVSHASKRSNFKNELCHLIYRGLTGRNIGCWQMYLIFCQSGHSKTRA